MIIDGKAVAAAIHEEIASEVAGLSGRPPCLAVILVGDNPASHVYVGRKTKACEKTGIRSIKKTFSETMTQDQLLAEIERFNRDDAVDGILVQLPLPEQIDPLAIIKAINPAKDVDGFHPTNMGKLLAGDRTGFVPCTPLGIQQLLIRSQIETAGANVTIVGRSNIVGKPMAALLMQRGAGGDATVTVAHSRTQNLTAVSARADILIAAIGSPHFITEDMVKEGAVVIDVGMNRLEDSEAPKGYRLVGDVDFKAVESKASAITPVPGGVGPMTIAMLLNNTLESYKRCV